MAENLRLLNFQVLVFFSVSFFFLRLCLSFLFLSSFSGCDFGSVFLPCVFCPCRAVAEIFRLYSFVLCVFCSCQAMFSCLVPFVFVRLCSLVRWLKFSSCGLAVFCSG